MYLDSLPPCPPSAAGAPPPCVHAAPVVLARPNRAQLAILASWTNQRARARHVGGKADKQDQTLVHRSKPQQKRRKAPRRSCLAACEEHSRDDIGIRVLCRPCEGRATIRCFAGLPGVQAETGNGHNLQHRGRRQRRALARPNVARKTPGTDVARHAAPCAAFLAATAFLILGPPWWCGGLSLFSLSSRRRLLIRADASALITPIVTASVTIGLLMRNVPWLA